MVEGRSLPLQSTISRACSGQTSTPCPLFPGIIRHILPLFRPTCNEIHSVRFHERKKQVAKNHAVKKIRDCKLNVVTVCVKEGFFTHYSHTRDIIYIVSLSSRESGGRNLKICILWKTADRRLQKDLRSKDFQETAAKLPRKIASRITSHSFAGVQSEHALQSLRFLHSGFLVLKHYSIHQRILMPNLFSLKGAPCHVIWDTCRVLQIV